MRTNAQFLKVAANVAYSSQSIDALQGIETGPIGGTRI
jgi:hypothetical protein